MILKCWDDLPLKMKNDSVKRYYGVLSKKRKTLALKKAFDFFMAVIILIILLPLFFIIGIAIKIDSKGPALFRQVRITQYGKSFKIFKFRTMVNNAEQNGTQVTIRNDERITRAGRILRKFRLDEMPQLLNIITGDMTFVGTRPEIRKYVEKYSEEMMATLLLPAGVTSEASIHYKDEGVLLENAAIVDEIYVNEILPWKMKYNLRNIENFNFHNDIKTIIGTIIVIIKNKDSKMTEVISFGERGLKHNAWFSKQDAR